MARVLIFRANFDLATRYGSAWLGEIRRIAEDLGHTVLDLEGSDATPENFYDALENFRPEIVIAMSHGNSTIFTGQDARIVFRACENDQLMSGTQAFFLSCLVGQDLLPSMDQKDARTVAGYIAEFTWVIHPDYTDRPLEDPYAYPLYRAVVEPCGRLLAGASWREWYDAQIAMFNRGISDWFESTDPYAPQIVSALEHDRDSLVVYGETVIRPALRIPPVYTYVMPFSLGATLITLFM